MNKKRNKANPKSIKNDSLRSKKTPSSKSSKTKNQSWYDDEDFGSYKNFSLQDLDFSEEFEQDYDSLHDDYTLFI